MIICGVDEPDLKETIKGLNNANNLGIDININITIIKQNYKALPNIISMLIPRFKNIHHFNFNFVDITGNVMRKGTKFTAKDIAPKYSDAEKYLVSAFKMLKKNKVLFRFERAPLCYAPGFEAFNSNANRAVGMEFHATSSIEQDLPDIDDNDVGMVKSEFCKYCNLNDICFGIEPNYNELYGNKELYPVFTNPNRVEYDIKKQNNHKEPVSFMEIKDINGGILKSLFDRFGGVKALIRKGERHIINLMLPEKQNLGEAHLGVIRSLLNLLREQGFDLSDFQILSKKKQESTIKTLQEKYKIGLIEPGTFVPKSVYDSMVINSIMLPKEIKESYGIINIIASEPFQETIFLGFADLITSKMKDKLKLLSRRKYFNALLDIYSTLKPKIKSNINLIRGTENNGIERYISLSRDFSAQEYLNEKVFKKNKVILDFVSERKLGPQNISRIDFDSLRTNREGELPF
jgi:hypothetical protein